MTGQSMHGNSVGREALDMRAHGLSRREGVRHRRLLAEKLAVDLDQQRRVLVGGAAEHHAVDMGKMRLRLGKRRDPAVEHHGKRRQARFQPVDARVIERGNVPVLLAATAP